jgi:hypothetical protein
MRGGLSLQQRRYSVPLPGWRRDRQLSFLGFRELLEALPEDSSEVFAATAFHICQESTEDSGICQESTADSGIGSRWRILV